MVRIAVVGLGNISKRHRANVKILYPDSEIFVVSARGLSSAEGHENIDRIFTDVADLLENKIDMAIVASPAPFHIQQAAAFLEKRIPVLIEKPLADTVSTFERYSNLFHKNRDIVEVSYNLRQLPSAVVVKNFLNEGGIGKVYNVLAEVGQYLPDWRPMTDYRSSVSANKKLGGGVLLELSHEIDYLTWFFGEFDSVYCVSKNSGALAIDVEDSVDAIFLEKSAGLTINLHMDFLQRFASRTCKIIGEKGNLVWDVLNNSVCFLGGKDKSQVLYHDPSFDRNEMYLSALTNFSQIALGAARPSVDLEHALTTLKIIELMRKSAEMNMVMPLEGDVS